jgi:hypothetical protein
VLQAGKRISLGKKEITCPPTRSRNQSHYVACGVYTIFRSVKQKNKQHNTLCKLSVTFIHCSRNNFLWNQKVRRPHHKKKKPNSKPMSAHTTASCLISFTLLSSHLVFQEISLHEHCLTILCAYLASYYVINPSHSL